MEVHSGDRNTESASETEVLFVAAPKQTYKNPSTFDGTDLSIFKLDNNRFIPIVTEFKYLGTILSRDCRDTRDIDTRIKKASYAFGSLRKSVFSNSNVSYKAKRVVYVG